MPKLSKRKIIMHEEACEFLKKDELVPSERDFVYKHWQPSYDHNVGWIASFFTPINMTYEFEIYASNTGRIVDICAGIGGLSRAIIDRAISSGEKIPDITCIERSQKFVEVGKKLVPEATWVQGDVFSQETWDGLGKFDSVISNPPFGNIGQDKAEWIKYSGVADLMVVAIALQVANHGTFILPQGSLPFRYSGENSYTRQESSSYNKFMKEYPNATFSCSSTDTSIWKDEWVDASPKVEIVNVSNLA